MSAISVSWLSFSWGAVIFETNYGLMQHSHIEIKNKLLKALDEDYNVVDMATVFEVVSILEQLPITKEILEVTRLGKFVNQFRRKTQNEALAKRAKGLVRRWRNLMIPNEATVNETSQQNGTVDHSATTSTATATTTTITSALTKRDENYELSSVVTDQNSNNSSSSNNNNNKASPYCSSAIVCSPQEPNVDAVPRTHAANKRLRKQEQLLNKSLADEDDLSPRLKKRKINGLNNDTNFRARSSSPPPSTLRPSTPHRTAAAPVSSNNASSPSTFNVLPNCAEQPPRVAATFGVSNVPSSVPTPVPSSPAPAITPPVVQIVAGSGSEPSGGTVYSTTIGGTEAPPPPTTARSKKRTKKADRKKCYDDDLREKLLGMTDSVKVKTTQELVNDLMNHDKARAADDSADTSLSNVLPLSRSPAIPSSNFHDPPSTRSQKKNRSAASSEKHKQKHSNFNNNNNNGSSNNNNGSAAANCDLLSVDAFPLSPSGISSAINNKIDPNDKAAVILSGLPPLDLDSIVWSDEDDLSETVGVEDSNAVGKLVQEDAAHRRRTEYSSDGELLVEGVDGTYDEVDGQFKIWNEVVTRKTVKDELVYILPYTIID